MLSCQGSGDGDGSGSPGGGDSPTQSQLDEFFGVSCDYYRRCCEASGFSTEPLAECETKAGEDATFMALIERGNLRWAEPAFTECLNAYRNAPCTALSGPVDGDACASLFRGGVPSGSACSDGMDCSWTGDLPSICLRAGGIADDQPGVCRPLERVTLGAACISSFDGPPGAFVVRSTAPESAVSLGYCDPKQGVYCNRTDSTCHALQVEGAPCSADDPCRLELYCDGTCKPRRPAGSPCTAINECELSAFVCKDGTCTQPTISDSELCGN